MKKTAHNLSLIISVSAAAVAALAMCAAYAVCPSGSVTVIALVCAIPVAAGFVLYFVLKKVFQDFVLEQVRPIYGTLEKFLRNDDLKLKTSGKSSEEVNAVVAQVNDEVAKWARDRVKEISSLKANEKYRKEYLGNVSHELKTPLFNIQGYITTLSDGGLDDPEICTKYLARAEKNIERLISIVQELETISKFETGNMKLHIESFDLSELVRENVEFNEIHAQKKRITLKIGAKPKNPAITRADKGRINEVLQNLVVNSINYGKEGGTTTVGVYDIENKWLVEVQDDGIGISEENIQRVFERFFRVDKSRSSQSGGTGLGLSIVKHIIEAHGESITVRSKINEGTTFSFTLKKAGQ